MFAGMATAVRRVRDPEHRRRVDLLAETPLFSGLRRRLLGRLAVRLFAKHYEAGEEIFHEGDPGRALFVVASGEIEIVRADAEGGERQLSRLGERSIFGELALIDDLPRLATARAAAPSDLYILYRAHFDELAAGEPAVALALCRNLLSRLARYVRDREPPPTPDPTRDEPRS